MSGAADLIPRIDGARDRHQAAKEQLSEARGMLDKPEEQAPKPKEEGGRLFGNLSLSDVGHTLLDGAGMIPGLGAFADGANAVWYAVEGDWTNASLSAMGAIPIAGDAATAARLANRATDAVSAVDNVTDAARAGEATAREIAGQRRPIQQVIGDEDAARLRQEFEELGGNPDALRINEGNSTHYSDETNQIYVRGNVLPALYESHPRSIMSTRATLAHELGHQNYRGTKLEPGDWRDEFRASYHAARHAPSLSDEERIHLVQDAISRAQEAGAPIKPLRNAFIRRTLGQDYES
ncbi:hypothetical protein [Coleofasciculus sp. FACHB-SPT9]|uniref:hypothetical protein n=1 Tax=Cyanophyceae TaxID=3028117 RepID=UPI0016822E9A|nr:hypothetical protein [Coleofasciculus sp. FACHB-SPT9]MBD1890615.1 hypothetical protein [Coleofasciculus sp. FACHB-SPT9]